VARFVLGAAPMKHTLLGLALAVAVSGCNTDSPSSGVAGIGASPTPTVSQVTDTFSGTVDVGGSDFHTFTVVATGGSISATLTAAGPPPTIFMGFGVGVVNGTSCSLLTNGFLNTQASASPQLVGTINAGTYCLAVYDIGNQSAQIAYTATVTHF